MADTKKGCVETHPNPNRETFLDTPGGNGRSTEAIDQEIIPIWRTIVLTWVKSRADCQALRRRAGPRSPWDRRGHPPVALPAWPDADRRTRLVFILRDLDESFVTRLWDAFLGKPAIDAPDAAALTDNPLALGGGFR